jgi:hypothetical protein
LRKAMKNEPTNCQCKVGHRSEKRFNCSDAVLIYLQKGGGEAGSLKVELVGQGKKKPNPSSFSAKVERLLAADASCATRLPAQSYETLLVVKKIITASHVTIYW